MGENETENKDEKRERERHGRLEAWGRCGKKERKERE